MLNVLTDILINNIVSPVFLTDHLKDEHYLNMLQDFICPRIVEINTKSHTMMFLLLQDGVPLHYTVGVQE